MDILDVLAIEECVSNGNAKSASEFVQKAVRMYLKTIKKQGNAL